ncbi:MAG TPA: DUF3656 domain-containing protein [Gemmatimonadaceae bacterium]
MIKPHRVPELLAPAGSLDAARAAVANGADAVYFGAGRFNARDDGAQLTLDELAAACALAHSRGVRVYLTLNTLLKPGELSEALWLLGEAIDRGIDAVIVQDVGLIRLIQRVYPDCEIHGSTQLTIHDVSGARLARALGLERVVMARENTLDDLRAIRAAVPELALETFVHGALCISYSGQCLMSGMISERSANRGSCAQACRKDYVLTDDTTGAELDRGFLISARDLAAHDLLPELADLGITCLKIEGRKKKPEYVAVVVRSYREFLRRVALGERAAPSSDDVQPLVQIYSRGFTTGMYRGRAGRDYITRSHPDNRGAELGVVVEAGRGELILELAQAVSPGDGLAFEPPVGTPERSIGFSVQRVRTLQRRDGLVRQAVASRTRVPVGWRVVRSSQAELLRRARESFARLDALPAGRAPLAVRVSGRAGMPLRATFAVDGDEATVDSAMPLQPASSHALDESRLRQQFGRLGTTPFTCLDVEASALQPGLFLPVSELNRMRQEAVEALLTRRDWAEQARLDARRAAIRAAVTDVPVRPAPPAERDFTLIAEVHRVEDAQAALAAGASEIVFDPFLRHPVPPVARVRALAQACAERGATLRLRTPTIVRPEDRPALDKWLALDLPLLSGHLGLACELAKSGRQVVADYAVNCFNPHTAAELFSHGIERVTASVELTVDELGELVEPWAGQGFEVVVYGRPEGMTLEHCVLSAAFDREPTTCRDLCVQKHRQVTLTDPAGYPFPVATDSDCRNRLLHSRPIEGSEFLPRLWRSGISHFRAIFNVPGDRVSDLVAAYHASLSRLAGQEFVAVPSARDVVGRAFTRGHFIRPV